MKVFHSQQRSQRMCKRALKALSRPLIGQGVALAFVIPTFAALPVLATPEDPSTLSVSAETMIKQSTRRSAPRPAIARPAPPRQRQPRNRVQPGGGLDIAAHACELDSAPLTALVPVENPVMTMRDHPTFLFYLPDAPEAVDHAEFILLSADEKEEIYSVKFSPTASGIVSISLPAEAEKALAPGYAYHWYLNLHCQTATGIPSVNGWVQRLAPDESLVDSPLPEVWYDEVSQAALDLRQTPAQGGNAWVQWQDLLTAVGLEELIGVPVLGPISRNEVAIDLPGEASLESSSLANNVYLAASSHEDVATSESD